MATQNSNHYGHLNFSNIGYEETLTIRNIKWRVRTFFGIRLGKRKKHNQEA